MNRISDSSFAREVLAAAAPVLVTFTAGDCAPCRPLLSMLDEVAHDIEGRVKFVTLDVVNNPESRALYHVHGLPTLALFVGGAIVARRVGGTTDKRDINEWIASSLVRV